VEKRAEPLLLAQLSKVLDWHEEAATAARTRGDRGGELRHRRDRALVALGFWRGFRGDELIHLQVEHIHIVPGQGMTCFLSHTKGDRQNQCTTFKVPALSRCCPVAATESWIAAAELTDGPLIRRVDCWAAISPEPMHPNSLIRLLRRAFAQAGLPTPEVYSGHSMRRRFAAWADANNWNVKELMDYVGWKDIKSAMRYLSGSDPFSRDKIESSLASTAVAVPAPVASGVPEPPPHMLELALLLSLFTPRGRGPIKARRIIEEICLAPFGGLRLDAEGTRYRLTIGSPDPETLDEAIAVLLDEMYRVADNHRCFLEASVREVDGPRRWD